MSDKQQILTTLREELDLWERLLAGFDEELVTAPRLAGGRSIKDQIAHLRAWQQRSIARLEAALHNREPEFPVWPAGLDPNSEPDVDRINDWIFEAHRDLPWPTVHRDWKEGFELFMELGEAIPETQLMTPGRYPWLSGLPLSFILEASLEHHVRDHREPLVAWLWQHGELVPAAGVSPGAVANRSMPPGTIIPELVYHDFEGAIAWLTAAFGFTERLRVPGHRSQLVFRDATVIVIAADGPPAAAGPPATRAELTHTLMVRVDDVDHHCEQARQAGARVVSPPETYPFGERQYTVDDPGGHRWTFTQTVADVAPEEWGGRRFNTILT